MITRLIQYWGRLAGGLVFFALGAVQASAHDLYWTEEEVIMASDIDGENVTEIFDGTGMEGSAVDVVVTDEYLYWSDNAPSEAEASIWRANLDGSEAQVFVESNGAFSSPQFLAISEVHEKIYFSDFSSGLFQADLEDGGNLEVLFDDFPAAAQYTGLALRGENDEELVWITASMDTIFRTQLPSGNTSQQDAFVDVPGAGETYGLAYDAEEDHLYFTNFGTGTLSRFDLATAEATLLRDGLTGALGLELSPSGTHLLIAERDAGVSAYQIDNFGFERLVESEDAHFGVAASADPADLPPGEDPGDLPFLFRANFDADSPGSPPFFNWGSVSGPGEGAATVLVDADNDVFGMGEENRFLRVESAANFGLTAAFDATEVLTLSFDYIGRVNFGDGNRWLNVEIRQGGTTAHITSIRNLDATIRGVSNEPSIGGTDWPVRIDTVMNNSTETIVYDTPGGGTTELGAGMASVWLFHYVTGEWEHLIEEYVNSRSDSMSAGTPLDNVRFNLDSGAIRSFDLDNVYVFEGALVGELAREADLPHRAPPDPLPVAWSLSPGDRPYLGTGTRERGLAIHPEEGYLLLVRRAAPPTVAILDGLTGDDLGTLSVDGVTGGFGSFHLNKIAIDEEGVIYAANLAVDTQDDNFRIYRWADKDADPELVFDAPLNSADGSGSNRRFGDSLVVLGSGDETEIILSTWNTTAWARLTPLEEATDPDNQFEAEIFSVHDIPSGAFRDIVAGPNGYFYGAGGGSLYEIELDHGELTATLNRGFVLAAPIGPIGFLEEQGVMGGVDASVQDFHLFDAEDFTPLSINSFPTSNSIPNATGAVVFGNGMAYALCTDNGILALELELDAPLSFEAWIAGFDLPEGRDGPEDNPAGDGIPNLLKYALGLSPLAPGTGGLPVHQLRNLEVEEDAADYLTLTFTRPNAVSDVEYAVEAGGDPGDWPDSAVPVDGLTTDNGDGTTTYTYRDLQPIEDSDRRFLRLSVEWSE